MSTPNSPADARVTVVIPAWGTYVAPPLERAVASAHTASREPVQVLVVDNAHEHPITLDGATVIRCSTRHTLGQARNIGLAAVRSAFVVFLDADDELLPGAIDLLPGAIDLLCDTADRYAERHGQAPAAVAGSLVDPVTAAAYPWPTRAMRGASRWPALFRLCETIRASYPVNGSLIRTDLARTSGGFGTDLASAEDWEFAVSLAGRGPVTFTGAATLAYTPTVNGQWVRHASLPAQRRHQAGIRRRLRRDPGTPRWLRAAGPALWAAHQLDCVRIAHAQHRSRARSANTGRCG